MELEVKKFGQLTAEELYEILKVRVQVFVVEQECPYQDIDGLDQSALHIFLKDETGIRAYLRVFEKDQDTAQLGRVLTIDRGCGLGGEILRRGIAAARERLGKDKICLEAQTYAVGFYAREGFRVVSEEFLEDGIPHVEMRLELDGQEER